MQQSYIDVIISLSMSLLLGGIIVIEREYRAKETEFRPLSIPLP